MASKAKKQPTEQRPRALSRAERALLEATRASQPNPTLTPEFGVEVVERNRRGDYA